MSLLMTAFSAQLAHPPGEDYLLSLFDNALAMDTD